MNDLRSIEQIMAPPTPHWVGNAFRVHHFFPGNGTINMQRMSPFFLLDYGSKIEFPPSDVPRGVSVHPHRGFETVTIAYHGKVAHHDSAGNSGVISEGEVQWMTAASGVLHKEYHDLEWSQAGGPFQMVQIWINLPKEYKMSAPRYQALKQEDFGHYYLQDELGVVEVIAGNYYGAEGAAKTYTPVELYNVRIKRGAKLAFSFPKHYNTGCVVVEGMVTLNDSEIPTDHFVLFGNDGTSVKLSAHEDAIVLMMSGEPINESIVSYGPFVMNTKEEIIQAYEDLNNGKFGILEE